ncbi:hypothetical protein HPB52_014359 [Rhipicephalus sanguineus]|uniref:CCHC-type domain-containing protein n=1 Tax=Rhipicephalus sanguineus TaxID=34632 RepID=A0A9D4YQ66_RHISA|nr:hypothetical protein HPB52_014359 [Rhipicephalus sanguineus]
MAMANSDQLRKKRGALRTAVTRALTQLTDLLQQTDPNVSEVSVQLDYLKDRESALSRLDDAILAVTEEDDLDREVETAQDYSDKISYALACAKYWLQERHQATRTHAQASGSGSSNLELPNSVDAPDQTPEDRIRRAKDLLTFLRIQVEVREEGRLQLRRRPHESEKMSMATESTSGAEHIPSAAARTSSAVSVNQVCPLCNSSGHSIISCNATLSADDKRVRLRNNNCCFRCGTRNHIARLCKKSYSLICGTCRRRHLTILCELSKPVDGLPPTTESVALERPSLPSLRTVTTAQSTHIGSTAVLLQTGRIWAECGNRRLLVRVLLDSGSQRSYIREDADRKLQCSVVGREELSLITFGNSKSQRRLRAERVSVRLRSQFDDAAVELEALTIPEICSVTSPPLENNILQALIAKEYKVADACQADTWKEDDITFLIGCDAYWRVTTGKIDRINERLTAIDTIFGWMVQGPIKSDLRFPSSALFVSSSDSAADLDVPSMWCLDAIGIDGAHSQTLEGNRHLFGSELGVSKRNKNHPVDNAVTSGWKVEEGETAGEHVDAHLGRARRRHWWQNGGDAALAQLHHDEDRLFEILHAEYIVIKHVKDALNAIRVGPKDGRGCDSRKSMTAVNRHCRNQSERLAGMRVLSADCKSPLKSVLSAQHRRNARGVTVPSMATSTKWRTRHKSMIWATCLSLSFCQLAERTRPCFRWRNHMRLLSFSSQHSDWKGHAWNLCNNHFRKLRKVSANESECP